MLSLVLALSLFLAQTAPSQPGAGDFNWSNAAWAVAVAVAGILGHWLGGRGRKIVEAKLLASGHPQAAAAFDLLVDAFSETATDAAKQRLAQDAKDAGVDHPAISAATK